MARGWQVTLNRMFQSTRVTNQLWTQWVVYGWLILAIMAYGPTVERVIFPVVSSLEIISIEDDGIVSRIFVKFEKKRPCEYLGINWDEILPDGSLKRAPINLKPASDGSGSTRPQGNHVAGPWYVGIPPEKINTSSQAVIAYRCHPLWTTEAYVWP